MGTIRKIQLDCRRATSLIEKRQYTRLTVKERLHLLIHLAGCGVCRLFQKQSRWINDLIRSLTQPPLTHDTDGSNAPDASDAGEDAGASTGSNTRRNRLDEAFKKELQEKINGLMP